MTSRAREILQELFHCALAAVNGSECVTRFLARHPLSGPQHVAAVGKAAEAMMQGALQALGPLAVRALVVARRGTRQGQLAPRPGLRVMEAAHPVPDQSSLVAGSALVDFAARVPAGEGFLLLVSGGASSLVELPLPGVSLAQLQRLNRFLLGSGLDIHQCNGLRKAVSRIKGGGLLDFLHTPAVTCLMLSDVPGDEPGSIGSGLLVPAAPRALPPDLPGWARALTRAAGGAGAGPRPVAQLHVIAGNATAREAAGVRARELGLALGQVDGELRGDARAAGQAIGRQLCDADDGLYLWGGETTVALPPHPGQGGRNQHLALSLAARIAGQDRITALAAGTDGNDGEGPWAGALVDGSTLARGQQAGLDAVACLDRADAGRFLAASGDLLCTGATGTNVSDLVIALVGPPAGHMG